MIVFSYCRLGSGAYIAHTDVLKTICRTLRRCGIDVAYSDGFNRHMRVKLTHPLPLGVSSVAEWAAFEARDERRAFDGFASAFNAHCPCFLRATDAYLTVGNPKLAAKIIASDYRIDSAELVGRASEIADLKNGFVADVARCGKIRTIDYSGYVYSIDVSDNGLSVRLSSGAKNLRADTFLNAVRDRVGIDVPLVRVTRTDQLLMRGGRLVGVREYMNGLA